MSYCALAMADCVMTTTESSQGSCRVQSAMIAPRMICNRVRICDPQKQQSPASARLCELTDWLFDGWISQNSVFAYLKIMIVQLNADELAAKVSSRHSGRA